VRVHEVRSLAAEQAQQRAQRPPVRQQREAAFQGQCFDAFEGGQGPTLVVIPGIGQGQQFAVGRTVVTNADYGLYCSLSKGCKSPAGAPTLPLTSVSLADAQRYMDWLTAVTGAKYRLPTDEEWTHAAEPPGWQDKLKADNGSINCLVTLNGATMRGGKPTSVTDGPKNDWGLVDYVGNAQQWVRNGGSVAARGGAFSDDISQCRPDTIRTDAGGANANTGFRVLREIK